ncbi:MAG: hypothetical protein ABF719_10685 [Acetobacter sp.]|nr:hypothetical protein [Acetobacter okinawensis]
MDGFLTGILYLALPFVFLSAAFALALGPIANRLAAIRKRLEQS